MAATSPPIPEQGQLVDVRQRRYVVTEVEASTLPASPLKPAQPVQHLVTLASVEDDALGEELPRAAPGRHPAAARSAGRLPAARPSSPRVGRRAVRGSRGRRRGPAATPPRR